MDTQQYNNYKQLKTNLCIIKPYSRDDYNYVYIFVIWSNSYRNSIYSFFCDKILILNISFLREIYEKKSVINDVAGWSFDVVVQAIISPRYTPLTTVGSNPTLANSLCDPPVIVLNLGVYYIVYICKARHSKISIAIFLARF